MREIAAHLIAENGLLAGIIHKNILNNYYIILMGIYARIEKAQTSYPFNVY